MQFKFSIKSLKRTENVIIKSNRISLEEWSARFSIGNFAQNLINFPTPIAKNLTQLKINSIIGDILQPHSSLFPVSFDRFHAEQKKKPYVCRNFSSFLRRLSAVAAQKKATQKKRKTGASRSFSTRGLPGKFADEIYSQQVPGRMYKLSISNRRWRNATYFRRIPIFFLSCVLT